MRTKNEKPKEKEQKKPPEVQEVKSSKLSTEDPLYSLKVQADAIRLRGGSRGKITPIQSALRRNGGEQNQIS